MFILPIKSRLQIVKERENPESIWTARSLIIFIAKTPEKNIGPNSTYRAEEFCRLLPIVTKKIHKKAVVRNKFRRRIKEAFRRVDKNLLKNQHDYQILARQSIFKYSMNSIVKDIESCLNGTAILGIPEKQDDGTKKKKKKSKNNRIKTSDALRTKLK